MLSFDKAAEGPKLGPGNPREAKQNNNNNICLLFHTFYFLFGLTWRAWRAQHSGSFGQPHSGQMAGAGAAEGGRCVPHSGLVGEGGQPGAGPAADGDASRPGAAHRYDRALCPWIKYLYRHQTLNVVFS